MFSWMEEMNNLHLYYYKTASFSPYTPPPDEQKSNRSSIRYSHIPTGSTSGGDSTGNGGGIGGIGTSSKSAGGKGISGVRIYRTTEQIPEDTIRVNKYETSMPIRVDIEAALTYVLGCVTGVFFLIFEHKNDYVRFHAWQSSLLFSIIFLLHFILIFISTFLSWILFIIELFLIGYLGHKAYVDGESLDRYEVPIIGRIASNWVDTE
nr:9660_t:CDS:2 [Entrophospora candida]